MKLLEKYTQNWSDATAAQFKFKERNEPRDGGYVTGVSFFPEGATNDAWGRVAALVWTKDPWGGTAAEYSEVERLCR